MSEKKHYAEFAHSTDEFVIQFNGTEIARSSKVLQLNEFHEKYEFDPVYYFPLASVKQELLQANEHHTKCPIKGEASYWNLQVGDTTVENGIWAYPNPIDECLPVKGYVAFDLHKGIEMYKAGERIKNYGYRKQKVTKG